ncbi:hypothetical protein A0J51_01950 [Gluconobacter japonicus]|nr:hypothetical protein A0J51_01950 [Gluconobacter japonicus]
MRYQSNQSVQKGAFPVQKREGEVRGARLKEYSSAEVFPETFWVEGLSFGEDRFRISPVNEASLFEAVGVKNVQENL